MKNTEIILDTLNKIQEQNLSPELKKIEILFNSSKENLKLFLQIRQIFVSYNSFNSRMYSAYYMEFVQNQKFKSFLKDINKKIKNNTEIIFNNTKDFIEFVDELKQNLEDLNQETENLIKLQQEHQDQYQKLINLNIYDFKNDWNNYIKKMYQNDKSSINLNISYKLSKIIEKQTFLKLQKIRTEQQENKKQIEFYLKESKIELLESIKIYLNEFLNKYKEIPNFLISLNIKFLEDEMKKLADYINKERIHPIRLQLKSEIENILQEINKKSFWQQMQNNLDLIEDLQNKDINKVQQNIIFIQQNLGQINSYPNSEERNGYILNFTQLKKNFEDILYSFLEQNIHLIKTFINTEYKNTILFIKNKDIYTFENKTFKEELQRILFYEQFSEKVEERKNIMNEVNKFDQFLEQNLEMDNENFFYEQELWNNFLNKYEIFKLKIDYDRDMLKDQILVLYDNKKDKIKKLKEYYEESLKLFNEKMYQKKFIFYLTSLNKMYNTFKTKNQELILNIQRFPAKFEEYCILTKNIDQFLKDIGDWNIFLKNDHNLQKYYKQPWKNVRNKLDELENIFQEQDLIEIEQLEIKQFLSQQITLHKQQIELLKKIKGEIYDQCHWKELQIILHQEKQIQEMTLNELLNIDFQSKISEINELNLKAKNEKNLKQQIDEVNQYSLITQLKFQELKNSNQNKSVQIVTEFNELFEELSEKLLILNNIKNSYYVERYQELVDKLFQKLGGLEEILINLQISQQKWIYLQPLISNKTLRLECKQDLLKFQQINKEFIQLLSFLNQKKTLIQLNEYQNLGSKLQNFIQNLDQIKKNLSEFLEKKRNQYYRLYFLGDEDLMELLGNLNNEDILNKIFVKIFSSFKKIIYDPSTNQISGGISELGEQLLFKDKINLIDQNCEIVLQQFEDQMKCFLKREIENVIFNSKVEIENIGSETSQIISLVHWIQFYKTLQEEQKLQTLKDINQKNISFLSKNSFDSALKQFKRNSLILDSIYQKDILQRLEEEGLNGFLFFSLLKYELQKFGEKYLINQQDFIFLKIGLYFTSYVFEYQGNEQKLIFTPLTEKCFFILSQAMHIGLGGNPYGPAGTGKTETVKAMGKCFGNSVLVFNCDENLEFQNICRIFKGLVGSGALGCFDEFNRLDVSQLSAISQVIQKIQFSLRMSWDNQNSKETEILDKKIKINSSTGIFITMNPASKNYKGRSELPDCLKILFRPIAMHQPDMQKIIEVILISGGFESSFANKVSDLLTKFSNSAKNVFNFNKLYDWGLRALKNILIIAGQNLAYYQKNEIQKAEFFCLMDSLKKNFSVKIQEKDQNMFNILLNIFEKDLKQFCDVTSDKKINNHMELELHTLIDNSFKQMQLNRNLIQSEKIIQFNYLLNHKVGICLIGPSYSGKTTIFNLLCLSLKQQDYKVITYIINPKIMDKENLFGHFDTNGVEFEDGVFVHILRESFEKIKENEKKQFKQKVFIVFDGDVDPVWIEALNSSLDDNRLFTLPNGERFLLPQEINIIFECDNLEFASPATISRLGIIYVQMTENKNLMNIMEITNNKIIEDLNQIILEIFEKIKNLIEKQEQNVLLYKNYIPLQTCSVKSKYEFFFYCNKQTTINDFLLFLKNLTTIQKNTYRPKNQGILIIYIFEILRIKSDAYKTKQLEQFLLEISQRKSFFENKVKKNIEGIYFVIVLDKTEQNQFISNRLLNRLYQVNKNSNNQSSICTIENTNIFQIFIRNKYKKILDNQMQKVLFSLSSNQQKKTNTIHYPALNKNFFQKGKKCYKNEFQQLNEEKIILWQKLNFFQMRFKKLFYFYENIQAKCLLYVCQRGTGIRECINFFYSYQDQKIFEITNIENNYNKLLFLKELRELWNLLQNHKTILYLEQVQFENDSFLSLLDNLINFENFELFEQELKFYLNLEDQKQFEEKVKQMWDNLSIVISWDKNDEKNFETKINEYSCFENNFLVIRDENFDKQDKESLIQNFEQQTGIQNQQLILKMIQQQEFSSLIYFKTYFQKIFQILNKNIENKKSKFNNGLQKLQETEQQVKLMSDKIENEKQILSGHQHQMDIQLDEITKSTIRVNEEKLKSEKISAKLQIEKIELIKKQEQIQEELDQVTPLVTQAKQDIKSLNKSNLDELRGYKYPPDAVVDIFTSIMKLMNEMDVSWSNMKKFLSKRTVIDQIVQIDPRQVQPNVLKEVEQFIMKKKSSFEYSSVLRFSKAAAPIAQFVKVIIRFVKTVHDMQPLEESMQTLSKNLKKSQTLLDETNQKINDLIQQQSQLKQSLQKKSYQIQLLNENIQKNQEMLNKARKLVEGLKSEQERWKNNLDEFEKEEKTLKQKIFIVSFFMTFLSNQEDIVAKELMKKFIKKNFQELGEFNYLQFLSAISSNIFEQNFQQKSYVFKLNQLAIEMSNWNQIISDQNEDLLKTIKVTEEIQIISYNDKKLFFKIDIAMKFGKIMFIKDLPKIIDYKIYLVKEQRIKIQDERQIVKIGSRVVEINQNFNIYLITKENILNHNFDEIQQIIFHTSSENLKEQILSLLVHWKEPQLEKQKEEIMNQQTEVQQNLSNLEEELLNSLSKQVGNILDNEELLLFLENIKSQSNFVKHNLIQIETLKKQIEEKREKFLLVTEKICKIILRINSLQRLHPLYIYSSNVLQNFLLKLLNNYTQSFQENQFLQYITERYIEYVVKGLFEKDIIPFLLLIVKDIGLFDRPSEQRTFENFLQFEQNEALFQVLFQSFKKKSTTDNKIYLPQFIPENKKYLAEMMLKPFPNIIKIIENSTDIEEVRQYSQSLDPLEKIVLYQLCFEKDLVKHLNFYLSIKINPKFTTKSISTQEILEYQKSIINQPILIILSKSVDLSKEINEYCKKMNFEYQEITNGECTKQQLIDFIKQHNKNTNVVHIKNLHLMPEVANSIISQYYKKSNKITHLIISTNFLTEFQNQFFEKCFKFTLEQTPSVLQSFQNNEKIQRNVDHNNKIISSYSFIHALIEERTNFNSRGWSKKYDFNENDLKCSFEIIKSSKSNFRVDQLGKFLKNFIYSGKTDREEDLEIIDFYFSKYFCDKELEIVQKSNQEKFKDIEPEIFGLDKTAAINQQQKRYNEFCEKIHILTDQNQKEIQKVEKEQLTRLIEQWNQIEFQLEIKMKEIKIQENGISLSKFFEEDILIQYKLLITELKNIFDKLKKYLLNQIKSEEVPYFSQLIKFQTPEILLDIWGNKKNIEDYLNGLIQLKQNLEKNYQNISHNKFIFDMQGILSPQKFFEYLKIKKWQEKMKIEENIFLILPKESMVNKQISIQNIFLQGADLDENFSITPIQKQSQNRIEICLKNLNFFNGKNQEIMQKIENIKKVPLYYDISREEFLCNLYFVVNKNHLTSLTLSSVYTYLYN